MENVRTVGFVLAVLAIFVVPSSLNSYEAHSTHPALTSEMVRFYESLNGDIFSGDEVELIVQGAIDEDDSLRFFNHFHDPIHKVGLTFGKQFATSKEWVNNVKMQSSFLDIDDTLNSKFSKYYSHEGDFTWQRAIYEYVHGDKEKALLSLGHVLHLIEDLTVPDHTRNDPHPNVHHDRLGEDLLGQASPYEVYTNRFDRDSIDISFDNLEIVQKDKLDDYFDEVALYTNTNFLSKDTLFDKYGLPTIESDELEKLGGISYIQLNKETSPYYLVAHKSIYNIKTKDFEETYFIDDPNNLVMSSYWNILSKEAGKNGAGGIDLFFREVEKERKTNNLKAKNVNPFIEGVKNIWNKITFWKNDDDTQANIIDALIEDEGIADVIEDIEAKETEVIQKITETPEDTSDSPQQTETEKLIELARRIQEAQSMVQELQRTLALYQASPAQDGNQGEVLGVNTTTVVSIAATGSNSGSEAVAEEEVSPEQTEEQENDPSEEDQESDGDTGGEETEEVIATTTPKALISGVTFTDCDLGVLGNKCLDFDGNVSLSVETDSEEFLYIKYVVDNGIESITSTSTEKAFLVTVDSGTSITIGVSLVYVDNTESALVERMIETIAVPIVINEIAWMGTEASANDEWIELYNRTNVDIDVSGWRLVSDDGSTTTPATPEIDLAGIIPAQGYFLLERTDDNTVSDVVADQTYVGSLGNDGEVLSLYFG